MPLKVGDGVWVRTNLSAGNGDREDFVHPGEIIAIGPGQMRIRFLCEDLAGKEIEVPLGHALAMKTNEEKKSLSQKALVMGMAMVFFFIVVILKAIGFIGWAVFWVGIWLGKKIMSFRRKRSSS